MTIQRRRQLAWVVIALALLGLGLSAWFLLVVRPSIEAHDLLMRAATIDVSTGPGDTNLSAEGMAPGDVATGVLTVTNSSRASFKYAMHHGAISADSSALASALRLTITTGGSSCQDTDGSVIYDGPLADAAIGDGPTARDLAPATSETLCFKAELPVDTGNRVQGSTAIVRLSFAGYPDGATP
jgi:hypothetical protein